MNVKREEHIIEFDKVYEELYEKFNLELNKKQKKIKEMEIKINIILGICILIYLFLIPLANEIKESIFLVCIFCMIFLKLNLRNEKKQFLEIYKKQIISKIISLLNNDLQYYPKNREKEKEMEFSYKYAGFENEIYDFCMDDYIEGDIEDDLTVKISNIEVNKKNDKYENDIRYFNGIYVIINGINQINKSVKITYKESENFEDNVEMDNEEFEKIFNVFSEDKILAMQILTHDVMEEMITFYEKYKIKFEIILEDKEIHIRFATGEMFEPDMKKGLDKQLLYKYYAILNFVIETTKKINKTMNQIEI